MKTLSETAQRKLKSPNVSVHELMTVLACSDILNISDGDAVSFPRGARVEPSYKCTRALVLGLVGLNDT